MDLLQTFKTYLDIRQISYITDNDVVIFSYDTWNLMLFYEKESPSYLRMALPKIDSIDEDFDKGSYRSALRIAAEYKVVKAVIIDDSLWFLFENFLPDYDYSNIKLFDRAIKTLVSVGNEWRNLNIKETTSKEEIANS